MLNLTSNQANTCYTLAKGSAPFTIKLVKAATTDEETFSITLTEVSNNWSSFSVTPTLENCDGNYFIYANGTEVEKGMIKVDDGNPTAIIEGHDPR